MSHSFLKNIWPADSTSRRLGSTYRYRLAVASCIAAVVTPFAQGSTSTITTSSDHYTINNGTLNFQLYFAGSNAGKITSITYDNQQMVGSKGLYYDIEGSPNIYLGSGETYSTIVGSNYIEIQADHPATATEPLEVTWSWILKDGDPGFSTYLTYTHTTAMANYQSDENRDGAEFFNGALFNYSSISDNFWGYQAAGNADRAQGRFVTAETQDMRGVPSEYIKNYETKYDWRTTYQNSDVIGLVTAANTSAATRAASGTDFGVWSIYNPRAYESWNAGPTQPQTTVADGASMIPSPAASHFGGPDLLYTGNMTKEFGPFYTYFNTGANINSMRADAEKFTTTNTSSPDDLNNFYDTVSLKNYVPTSGRGDVVGDIRLGDGSSMSNATVILSAFDPVAYTTDPIGQEYQRRAAGYDYWVTPSANGTFNLSDVQPGTYRVTIINPGSYREGTFDNITVAAGNTTNVGNLTWTPDISGKTTWQIGTFDRTAAEFRDGNNYNNWIDTFNEAKEFPNGVNYTVNPAKPTNDVANWSQNWPLNQINGSLDFFNINFTLASAPAANSVVTLTVSIADEEFINDLAALVYNAAGTSYNRVDASFDHTADNAPATERSGDTSSQVLYRKLTIPASWLHAGSNKISLHIVGGNLQWDALNLSIQNPGTFSLAQWSGGNGVWSDPSQWQTQADNYTNINKGAATINGVTNPNYPNDTSTTFADGATHTAPVNNNGSQQYYDAVIDGGNVTLNATTAIQKLSLLAGALSINSGITLTANDTFAWAGGNIIGPGSINALTTTTINFTNALANGGKITSAGAITWDDTAVVALTDSGTQWTTTGLTFGQAGASGSLGIISGATFSAGTGNLTVGSQGSVSMSNGTIIAAAINTSGMFSATSSHFTLTSTFTNSGVASIDGGLTGTGVINSGGFFALLGTNTYTGNTTISGGTIQFDATTSIGGSGASVTVGPGGAIAFTPGITNAAFLARLNTSSTGSFALTSIDAATTLNFTSGPFTSFANMALGAVSNMTYSGLYTPAGNIYRLGGGGATLTYSSAITGAASVNIGNTGSGGIVVMNSLNSYTGPTTLNGSTLAVYSLNAANTASDIGSSTNISTNLVFNGGTLQYLGAGNSTDRLFTLTQNGGTIDASGTGSLAFSNTAAVVATGTGNRTLLLIGNSTLSNTFAPALADPASGSTALTKDGTTTWILGSGSKTYSGDTTIANGTLQLGIGASLPNGAGKGNLIVATGATMELSTQSLTINALNDGPAGPITTDNPNGWATPNGPGGGTVDNSGALAALNLGNNNATGLYSGLITGNINLIKNGTGTQTLTGDNTYTGTTTLNAGTLVVGIGGTPSSTGPGDGGFRGMLGAGTITNNATLIYNRGYYTTVLNTITGNGTLKQTANAELVLGSSNTYTGPTIIGGDILNIGLGGPSDGTGLDFSGDSSLNASTLANGGVASSIGASSSAASNLILDGGTLFYSPTTAATTNRLFSVTQAGGAIYASGALTFNGSGAVAMTGAGNRTLSLGGDSTSSSTFGLSIGDPASGITSLTKDRSNTWILTSAAVLTYSGDTTILSGILQLGSGEALPFGAGKGNLVMPYNSNVQAGTNDINEVEMAGTNLQINALIGGTTAIVDNNSLTRTLTIGNNNAGGEYDGILTGNLAVTKIGTAIEIFTGNNTYSGTTSLNSGTLSVSATANLGGANNTLAFNGGILQVTGTTFTAPARTLTWGASGGGFDIATAGNIFTVTSNLSGGGLTKVGVGTLILSGSYTSASPTVITAGTLQLNGTGAFSSGNLTNNGALIFNHTSPFSLTANISGTGSLTQIGAGTTTITGTYSAGPLTLTTGNLTFATSAALRDTAAILLKTSNLSIASTSVLDVTNHDFMIGNSTLTTVQTEILNGFGAGPGGAEITSSTAIADGNKFLVPLDATAFGITSWDGVPVTDPNTIIIKFTYFGDANLDGAVDGNDFSVIAGNFDQTTPGLANIEQSWLMGDVNLDGVVDGNDFSIIAGNFGSTPLTGSPNPASPNTVPEPASLTLLTLAAPLLLRRRGKNTN